MRETHREHQRLVDVDILLFIGINFGLSMALALFVFLTGGRDSPYVQFGFVAMLFPAIAVLLMKLIRHEKSFVSWTRFPLGYLPGALLLMPAVMHAAMLPVAVALEGAMPWQDWLAPAADGLYHTPESRGWGALTFGQLAGRIALNALVGLLAVSLLATFEEIGWRGWLQPRLTRRLGARTGITLTAAIWALWHTPFALSGIHYLEAVPVVLTALILPVGHFGAGLVIGWFWHRTASIWIVIFAHGALNNWGQYAFKFMDGTGRGDALLLAVGGTALLATGVLLLYRLPPHAPAGADTRPHGLPDVA